MANIYEGRTTNEAIEKGLKDLNVSKKQVDIKVLEEEDKRSFFSILTPRVVKVELTLKENVHPEEIKEVKKVEKNKKVDIDFLLKNGTKYKHIYEKAKDGTYYWVSSEPVK